MTAPAIRLDAPGAQAFEVDTETRTIRGLLVPYGVPAMSGGQRWQFSRGSLAFADVSRVKLWVQHDPNRAVGVAFELDDREDGMYGALRVARGAAGDEALAMAEDGVWDGFSIGLAPGGKFRAKDGINHAVSAPLMEVSLTPAPSFDDARVHQVAASAAGGNTMDENETTEVETAEAGLDFSAITDAITAGFAALGPAEGPTVVPAGGPTFEVNEGPAYRFDGIGGEHDFSTDLIAFGRDRDEEAGARVMAFMQEQFAPKFDVQTGGVETLNPARNRPDMYVDERRFRTPLYDRLHKGGLTDVTPFVVPKFNSAANLVGDHTEGTEPTSGTFSATSQTITPSAVSGKVEITREVWDQGGNPQVSGLIWSKMVQHYLSAMEAKAYALLNAATVPAGQVTTITAGAADDDLVSAVEGVIVDLNFVAGGNTFDYAATQADLYRGLAGAVDASGRKLLPQYGPTNASGTARSKFASLDVAGTEFMPVPTLGPKANTVGKSYLLDTSAVHLWNSAPQRLQFETRVAYIDLGIWGYVAGAITDMAGVRRLDYKPTA